MTDAWFVIKERTYFRTNYYSDLTIFDEKELLNSMTDKEKSFGIKAVWIKGKEVLNNDTLDKEALKTSGKLFVYK